MTQPTALRLAAELEACPTINYTTHAAELRRLSIDNDALGVHLSERMKDLLKVEAQRDELLAALERSRAQWIHSVNADYCLAAIAKAQQ